MPQTIQEGSTETITKDEAKEEDKQMEQVDFSIGSEAYNALTTSQKLEVLGYTIHHEKEGDFGYFRQKADTT